MELEVRIKKKLGSFTMDITLESDSRRIGILGASGGGKSMTLKSIAGIETPDEGYIRIGDRVLFDSSNKINLKPQLRNVGYLFQNYALFPTMSVLANIEAGLKGTKEENRARALAMVEKFQLVGLEDRLPTELSGGQQQRVALARIMAYEPDVILLDEPFSALDVFLKDRLQQELISMLEDYKGIVIMVSHSRDEIYNFSEELLVIDGGRDVIYGNTKAIFKEPQYVPVARLSGCKNIVPATKIGVNDIFCPSLGVKLKTVAEVADDISCVGIRAHDFVPVWEAENDVEGTADMGQENCIPVKVKSTAEYPFEVHYYLDVNGEELAWYVQREQLPLLAQKGLPMKLMLPDQALLLLR